MIETAVRNEATLPAIFYCIGAGLIFAPEIEVYMCVIFVLDENKYF